MQATLGTVGRRLVPLWLLSCGAVSCSLADRDVVSRDPQPAPVIIARATTERVPLAPRLDEPTHPGPVHPTPAAPAKLPPLPDAQDLAQLQAATRQMTAAWSRVETYRAVLIQQQRVRSGRLLPVEQIQTEFRKMPFSVHFKWIGKNHPGREVTFVAGRYGGTIYARERLFGTIAPLSRVAPDSPLAMAQSRYPITEAGIGFMVDEFARGAASMAAGDTKNGVFTADGTQYRAEADAELPHFIQYDPRAGIRHFYVHPATKLPVLDVMYDFQGHLLEYFWFSKLQFNLSRLMADAVYDPAVVFGAEPGR